MVSSFSAYHLNKLKKHCDVFNHKHTNNDSPKPIPWCTSRPTPALPQALCLYDLSIEDLHECIGLNMWGVTEWMIKKDWETHRLHHWFQLWSKPARCRVFGRYRLKNLQETERGSDWLRLLSECEQEQCATDKQALTSQTGSLKCWTFETLFFIFFI